MPRGVRNAAGPLTRAVAKVWIDERAEASKATGGVGKTYRAIADEIARPGLGEANVARILRGEHGVTLEEFVAICGVLGCDPQDVLRRAINTLESDSPATDAPTLVTRQLAPARTV
jgi:DNA-binding Xre family transcriptional regulator